MLHNRASDMSITEHQQSLLILEGMLQFSPKNRSSNQKKRNRRDEAALFAFREPP